MSSDRVFREAAETNGKAHCNADVKQAGAYDPLNEGFAKRGDMEVDLDERCGWPRPPPDQPRDWFEEALMRGKGKVKGKRMEDFGLRHRRTWKEQVMERLREEGGDDAKHDAATWTMGDALAVALAELMDATEELGKVARVLAVDGKIDHSTDVENMINTADYLQQEILQLKKALKAARRW